MRGTATPVQMDTLVRIGGVSAILAGVFVIGAVGQLAPRAATLFVVSGVVFGSAMVGVVRSIRG
jgi:hypothetical protein